MHKVSYVKLRYYKGKRSFTVSVKLLCSICNSKTELKVDAFFARTLLRFSERKYFRTKFLLLSEVWSRQTIIQ